MTSRQQLESELVDIEKRTAMRWWLFAPVFVLLVGARPLMEQASFGRGPAAESGIITLLVFVGLGIGAYVLVKNTADGRRRKQILKELSDI